MRSTHRLGTRSASLWIVAVVALVGGCVHAPPSAKELATADYGSPVSQQEAERGALAFLKQHLKDPESARIEWGKVQQGWLREAPIHGGRLRFGYMLTANINAKNSFGAYTGYKTYQFLFFNGTLVSAYAQQEDHGTTYMGKIY